MDSFMWSSKWNWRKEKNVLCVCYKLKMWEPSRTLFFFLPPSATYLLRGPIKLFFFYAKPSNPVLEGTSKRGHTSLKQQGGCAYLCFIVLLLMTQWDKGEWSSGMMVNVTVKYSCLSLWVEGSLILDLSNLFLSSLIFPPATWSVCYRAAHLTVDASERADT